LNISEYLNWFQFLRRTFFLKQLMSFGMIQ
jgi:hypothetical protein